MRKLRVPPQTQAKEADVAPPETLNSNYAVGKNNGSLSSPFLPPGSSERPGGRGIIIPSEATARGSRCHSVWG